eukprot:4364632-Pyramimonas_sp.AAC.1
MSWQACSLRFIRCTWRRWQTSCAARSSSPDAASSPASSPTCATPARPIDPERSVGLTAAVRSPPALVRPPVRPPARRQLRSLTRLGLALGISSPP